MEPRTGLASPQELAPYLGVPIKTLMRWRYVGTGPRALKVGRHLRYRWADVQDWLDDQAVDTPQQTVA